jgi:hypothetical protein
MGLVHKKTAFLKKNLDADTFVLSVVENGYRVYMAYREPNNKSARLEVDFVRSEVARLFEAGLVIRSPVAPLCVNPLPDGGLRKRLVIDLLRHVNPLLTCLKYRMTTMGDVLAQTMPRDFQYLFDLEAAYHQVRLAPCLY